MTCPSCFAQYQESANYCKQCGTPMLQGFPISKKQNYADIYLIIYVAISAFTAIFQFAIQNFVDNWYEGPFKYLFIVINVISAFATLLIAFAIKSSTLKIIAIIVACFFIIHALYTNVKWLLEF